MTGDDEDRGDDLDSGGDAWEGSADSEGGLKLDMPTQPSRVWETDADITTSEGVSHILICMSSSL